MAGVNMMILAVRARRATGLALALALLGAAARADVAVPEIPRGLGAQCVEPVEVMRRDPAWLEEPSIDAFA